MRVNRRLPAVDITTYSFTDEQVLFTVKFALFTGAIVGGVIVGFFMAAFA